MIKQQNTLSILSCTEEVTGIPNEVQHTSLFHMLKMPYFCHGASCTRNVTSATQFLAPSNLHSLPKKLTYSNRHCFIHLTVFTASFSPLYSCKLEIRIMHISTLIQCTCLTRSCWYFLCAGTWVTFWKPQANYLLDLDVPYMLKMCLTLNSSATAQWSVSSAVASQQLMKVK